MTASIVLTSSLLVAVLAFALVREVRLRRALQRLLGRVLACLRGGHETTLHDSHGAADDDPDRWMRWRDE